MELEQWGWGPALQRAFDALDAANVVPARVARQDRTGYLVVHEEGEVFARLPGHLRDRPPAVGDWVVLDPKEPATIRALLPRRGAIVREDPGERSREQVVAANVDVLFIVASADAKVNDRRIERYLVLAASAGARPIVVLNKADLADEVPALQAGVTTLATSATDGRGTDALRALVPPGTTAAFVGPSGVGKSSLVNALLGEQALDTGEIREADHKGRHTTTARHLLPLPGGGVLLDTPGVRELGVWDAGAGVAAVFEDIEALALRCKFRDCAHESEPGCAVRAEVSAERLASWRKLSREAANAAMRADAAASRKAARSWGKVGRDTMRGKRERLRE